MTSMTAETPFSVDAVPERIDAGQLSASVSRLLG